MLLHIDGEVVEIRPSELLELITKPAEKKTKGKYTKSPKPNIFIEERHGKSSSGT